MKGTEYGLVMYGLCTPSELDSYKRSGQLKPAGEIDGVPMVTIDLRSR